MSRGARRSFGPILVLSALAAAGACADLSPSRALPVLPPLGSAAVRPALVLVDSSAGRATVAVLVETRERTLGAYQGTVRYDAGGLHLERVTVPDDGTRLSHVDGPGAVRLAGFAADGLAGREVARLEFRVSDWALLRDASVELAVAGGSDGRRLDAPERPARGTYRGARR